MKSVIILSSLIAALAAVSAAVDDERLVNYHNYRVGNHHDSRYNNGGQYDRTYNNQNSPRRSYPGQHGAQRNYPTYNNQRQNNLGDRYQGQYNNQRPNSPRRSNPGQQGVQHNYPTYNNPRQSNLAYRNQGQHGPQHNGLRYNNQRQYNPRRSNPGQHGAQRNYPIYNNQRPNLGARNQGQYGPQHNGHGYNNNQKQHDSSHNDQQNGYLSVPKTDFCKMNCKEHIGCASTQHLYPKTCSNVEVLKITPALIKTLTHLHNEKRNLIAGGNVPNYPAACGMSIMSWDNDLAYLAMKNVEKCEIGHDRCRKTKDFDMPGQNIHYETNSTNFIFDLTIIARNSVEGWFSEKEDCNESIIKYFSNPGGRVITHFTGMVLEHNSKLGCAAATHIKNDYKYVVLTCNYAHLTMQQQPVYRTCEKNKAGSSCKSRNDRNYPFLCTD